jgi:branched-chain amino acid transport system substrate-binding protein
VSLRLPSLALAALVLTGLVLLALGGHSRAASASVTAVASSACGPLQYGGRGDPEALVVSDLPLQGDSKQRSLQMNDAIRLVLEGANWQAGGVKVAFQACDDSNAKTGLWTKQQCQANANAYAADPSVLAVIGTYNSGCAEAMIPILSTAPGSGLAMVSPGNTLICLTQSSPSCPKGQPGNLYPGARNYARVVPNDAYQGAGLASFAKRHGVKNAFVLYAKDPTSLGQAKTFRGAARKLGIRVLGFKAWNAKASSYRGLMRSIAKTSPDAVLLAGLTEENGGRLIKDKVAVLGSNSKVKLLAPDGFAQQSTIELAGKAAKGMYASVPGEVPQSLTGPGKKLVGQLEAELKGQPIELYAPYAGQAAEVVLNAIGKGRSRGGVIEAVRSTSVHNGITGSFDILPSGDPSIGPITVSVAKKTFVPFQVLEPGPSLVQAARHG